MENRIYVASLSDYNAGYLHGKWIDLSGKDIDDVWNEVNKMLKESPCTKQYGDIAEEWAIHDRDGILSTANISEYESFEKCLELVRYIEDADDEDIAEYCLKDKLGNIDEATTMMENHIGTYESYYEYGESILEGYEIPENVKFYVDYEGVAKDEELNGYITIFEQSYNTFHVFLNS